MRSRKPVGLLAIHYVPHAERRVRVGRLAIRDHAILFRNSVSKQLA